MFPQANIPIIDLTIEVLIQESIWVHFTILLILRHFATCLVLWYNGWFQLLIEYFVPLNVAEERMFPDLCGAILSEALSR